LTIFLRPKAQALKDKTRTTIRPQTIPLNKRFIFSPLSVLKSDLMKIALYL
jgi:hypothetical protein